VHEGRRMNWPKIRYIQSRMIIEQAIIRLEENVRRHSKDIKTRRDVRES